MSKVVIDWKVIPMNAQPRDLCLSHEHFFKILVPGELSNPWIILLGKPDKDYLCDEVERVKTLLRSVDH